MILLDTNVISETMRSTPAPAVRRWLDEQATETLYLSSVTVAELRFGLGVLSDGRRKRALATTWNGVFALFEGRILSFDADAARSYADLAVAARQAGKGFPVPDGYIAAIAAANGFSIATRDPSAFAAAGLAVIDPWRAGPGS